LAARTETKFLKFTSALWQILQIQPLPSHFIKTASKELSGKFEQRQKNDTRGAASVRGVAFRGRVGLAR
jgi:hypothetical protein